MEMLDQMTRNKIQVIGFDLDNTLYPSTAEMQKKIREKIYEKISDLFGIDYEEAKRKFEESYLKIKSGSRAIRGIAKEVGYCGEIDNLDLVQEAIQEADVLDLIKPNPKLKEMLLRLKKKLDLDLITGSSQNLILGKLSRLGIETHLFDYVLDGDSGSKLDGDVFRRWVELRRGVPERMLYVGDNEKQDIDPPKSLGIKTCFIGEYSAADFQISNILDLERLLN